MSLAAPYQEHYYVADGVTTSFAFGEDFTALSAANVKCIIYFEDGTNCVPTFTVDMTTGFITIVTLTKPDGTVLTVPPAGSIVRVFRDTPEQQNVTASQLQNYTAKQLERIFDSIVAMIQEVSYSDLHKTIRLTETQRDVSMEQLKEENDQAILYWDFETRQLKATDYGQNQVVKSDTVDRLVYLQPEGKIYFIPKGSNNPIAIGSATIHNDLGGRNAPDCHPESAITNLTTHLQELRDRDTAIEAKADAAVETANQAYSKAETAEGVANSAYEKAVETERVVQTFDERITEAQENASAAKTTVDNHVLNYNNPHQVTASQVGLGNVDNTSDLDKPISTATQTALTAQQEEINALSGRGRFLSIWNCATGLPETEPEISPYEYKTGDYYIVGTLSSADPAVNYRPDGTEYISGVASTEVETEPVDLDDTYIFDGTNWVLQYNSQKEVAFSAVAGSPYDNTNLGNALNAKINKSGDNMTGELIMNYAHQVSFRNSNASSRFYFKADGQNTFVLGTSLNANIKLKWENTTGNLYSAISSATLGTSANKWDTLYVTKINNGADITVPVTGGTMALTSDIVTYTGSDGITLTGTNFTNSGVRSVSTGSTNGTISVNTNGTSADVAVYGLGSAAYTTSTDYATAAQGAKADTALQPADVQEYTANEVETLWNSI